MSRLSLPYAAQDLAQHLVPDPSPAVSVVTVAAVVMAAMASPFDEPQHLLRATEESPDLADVHVRLAFFPTTSDKQPYEASREKFRPEPLVFRGVGKRVRRSWSSRGWTTPSEEGCEMMNHFPTRVLAIDGSEEAELALQTAVSLARSTGSEMHVVHGEHVDEGIPNPAEVLKRDVERTE
jgi:Universal stress protein family